MREAKFSGLSNFRGATDRARQILNKLQATSCELQLV